MNPANQARRIGGLFGVGGGGAAAPDAVAPGDDPTGGISSPTDARRVAEIVAADEARQEAAEERAEAEIDAARKMEEAERNATEAIAEGNEELQFRIDQTQRSARNRPSRTNCGRKPRSRRARSEPAGSGGRRRACGQPL